MSVLTAEKNGIVIRARKSGATCVSVMRSFVALTALMPDADDAVPASTAFAPAMSSMKVVDGELIFGCRSRFSAYAKFAAVTCEPSANLYVLLERERVGLAVLGDRRKRRGDFGRDLVPPAAASLSGKFSSLHVVEYSICHECEKYASAGSMKSIVARRIQTKRAAHGAVLAAASTTLLEAGEAKPAADEQASTDRQSGEREPKPLTSWDSFR